MYMNTHIYIYIYTHTHTHRKKYAERNQGAIEHVINIYINNYQTYLIGIGTVALGWCESTFTSYAYIYICIHIYKRRHICLNIYIHISVYIYIYIYVHIYILFIFYIYTRVWQAIGSSECIRAEFGRVRQQTHRGRGR